MAVAGDNILPSSRPWRDDFSKGIWVSFSIHMGIVALLMLRTVFDDFDEPQLPPAIRVDIVGLPDKNPTIPPPLTEQPDGKKPEPPAPKHAEPPPKEAAKPPEPMAKLPKPQKKDEINLDRTKSKQMDALNKLKSMSALDKIRKEVTNEDSEHKKLQTAAAEARAKAGDLKLKGNILAAGTELTGIDRIQHEDYRLQLDRHIKPNWQIPEWLAKKGYRAQAVIRMDARGHLISKQMIRTSGNPDFDASVLETIDRSAPFPPPPEKLSAKVGVEGIIIIFGDEGEGK